MTENQDSFATGEHEIEEYGDERIRSFNAKVPKFLIITYVVLPIWGVVTFYLFWNGSTGWFDRGAWQQLQIAANTTFPTENHSMDQPESSAEGDKGEVLP